MFLILRLAEFGHNVTVLYTIDNDGVPDDPTLHFVKARISSVEDPAEFQSFFWEQTDSSVTLPAFFEDGDRMLGEIMLKYPEEVFNHNLRRYLWEGDCS